MSDDLHSHIILCEALSFSQGKTRPQQTSDKAKFLSNLALLLNGNQSYTAVYVNETRATVFIARNEPLRQNDKEYFNEFFRGIRLYAETCFDKQKETTTDVNRIALQSLVLQYNSTKIVKRLSDPKKLIVGELRKMAQLNTDQKQSFIDELQSNRNSYTKKPSKTEKMRLIKKNRTEVDYVQHLLEKLQQFLSALDELLRNQANLNDQQLRLTTGLADLLYESRLFRYMLNHFVPTRDRGEYYFEKASAHYRSFYHILKCLLNGKDRFDEIYKNIKWEHIKPTEQTHVLRVTPKQALQNIITNLRESDSSLTEKLAERQIEDFYPKKKDQDGKDTEEPDKERIEKFETNRNYQVHLHAEILLIDYLLNNGIGKTNNSYEVEIGISKMCCLLCSVYIEKLNETFNRCFCQTDSTHGNIYLKWNHRQNENPQILNLINEKLIEKIEQKVRHMCFDTNSLSPKKTNDSDVTQTSIEGDELDEKLDQEFFP